MTELQRPWRAADLVASSGAAAAARSVESERKHLPTDDWGEVRPGLMVLASGALYEPSNPSELRDLFHPSVLDAAGALVANVADLAHWGRALWGSDQVLSAESRAQRLADALPIGGTFAYGLGAVEARDDWGAQISHNGAVTGYVAWVGYPGRSSG